MNARPIPNRQLCCYEMFTTRLLSAASCAPGGDLLLALSILFRVRPTARLLYLSPPLRARIASTTLLRHASSSPSKSDACSIPFVRSRRRVGKANPEGRKESVGKRDAEESRRRYARSKKRRGVFHEGELLPRSEVRNNLDSATRVMGEHLKS